MNSIGQGIPNSAASRWLYSLSHGAGLGIVLVACLGFAPRCWPAVVFSENFDGTAVLPAGWTSSIEAGASWGLTTATNDTFPFAAWVFSPKANGNTDLTSPPIFIPTPIARLTFWHSYRTGLYWESANLQISIGGGAFTDILTAGGSFVTNGYYSGAGAWAGSSSGFILTEARLPAAASGQSIQLRWRYYSLSYGDGGEWFVDTISVADGLPAFSDDISVSISDSPDPIAIGANLNYLIAVTNTGPSTATAVLLTNILPAGVTLVSNTPSSGTCSNIGGVLVCGFGNLAGQSAATLNVVVRPTTNGPLTNRASVFRGEPDTYTLNNTASAVTLVTAPVLYLSNVTINEGNSGTSEAVIAVVLSPASTQTVTVAYSTSNGTALAGSDYQSRGGFLAFAPGENFKSVTIPIIGDTLDETNEVFFLNLSNPTNAVAGVSVGTATIVDDDQPPDLFAVDSVVVEGNAGRKSALLSVYLTAPSGKLVSVDYGTYDGPARTPLDYIATNGTLLFPPGTMSQTIAVPIVGDVEVENNEYFTINFFSLVNANYASSYARGWILNDDGLPGQLHHFSWGDITASVALGDALPVTLIAEDYFDHPVTNFTDAVPLSAIDTGGSHTLISPTNHDDSTSSFETGGYSFTPNTNLVVTHFRHYSGTKVSIWTEAGILLASQPVASVPGTWMETALSTPITLAAGSTYRIGVLRGGSVIYRRNVTPASFEHGTVNQAFYAYGDEFPPYGTSYFSLVDLRYVVGALPTVALTPTLTGNFTNGVWSGEVTLLQTASDVVLLADDGQGHVGRSSPFSVSMTNDIALMLTATPDPVGVGANLTYRVTVTNSGPSTATGVIVTNLLPGGVTFLSVASSQGTWTNFGGHVVVSLGTLPAASGAELIITVVAGGIGNLTNFAAVSRAEADFFPGNNAASVVTSVELPALTIDDVFASEGNAGPAPMVFNVRLWPPSGQMVSIHFTTADNTATSGNDYTSASGTLFFAPGQTNQTITVSVKGDLLNEADELLSVVLSNPTNATLISPEGVGHLLNDDPLPNLLIYGTAVSEGNVGSINALFTVALTSPSGQQVSANYYTYPGTAQSPADFIYTNGTLVFAPGTTTQTIAVPVNGDTIIENTETFFVYFSTLENATFGNSSATGFVVNDDGLPGQLHHLTWASIPSPQFLGEPVTVAISAVDAFNNAATNFTYPVSLSAYAVTSETSGTMLNSPAHSDSSSYSSFTLGYAFTPAADLLVTHVRHYFGSKVSIWTDDGTLLASQFVASSPGTWSETALAAPVTLHAGVRYRVGVYVSDGNAYWRFDGSSAFDYGTLEQGYYWYTDGFPQYTDSARWWFVDLRYTVQTLQPVSLTPGATTSFIGGQWAGSVSVLEPGSILMLRADDAQGHTGMSNPFAAPGIRLGITPLGSNLLLHWPAAVPGFLLEFNESLSNVPAWNTITNSPTVLDGQNLVTNSASAGQGFFRLRKP